MAGAHPDPEAACQVLRSFRDDQDPFALYDEASLEVEMGPAQAIVRRILARELVRPEQQR